MNRRPATTLVEVLVAIFIMGIGLMAILALFPLGAIRMAQAIQDDRAGQLAQNAAAMAQTFDLRNDPNVVNASLLPGGGRQAVAGGPGYPVYIDAIGWWNTGGAFPWVGNDQNPGIPRVYPSIAPTTATAVKWFSLLDDIRFDPTGIALAPLDRQANFSYGLMYRRPAKEVTSVTELAVVVYNRRLVSSGAALTPNELEYPATFNPANNTITVNAANRAKPPLHAGVWVLDATEIPLSAQNPYPTAHSYFYRVVSTNQLTADTYEVEVGTPLRGWPAPGPTPSPRIIIMDGVIDVLERGTGWPS